MSRREVALERLVGRKVLAVEGRTVGRLEEVRAEQRGSAWVVIEYRIGPAALLERLAARMLRFRAAEREYKARWDQLDPSDPAGPRLTCPVEELEGAPTGRRG
jgi:sporulation protein YlmC with PRC-barrel domain